MSNFVTQEYRLLGCMSYTYMSIAVNFKQCIVIINEDSQGETFYADYPTAMNFKVYPNQMNYGAGLLF